MLKLFFELLFGKKHKRDIDIKYLDKTDAFHIISPFKIPSKNVDEITVILQKLYTQYIKTEYPGLEQEYQKKISQLEKERILKVLFETRVSEKEKINYLIPKAEFNAAYRDFYKRNPSKNDPGKDDPNYSYTDKDYI